MRLEARSNVSRWIVLVIAVLWLCCSLGVLAIVAFGTLDSIVAAQSGDGRLADAIAAVGVQFICGFGVMALFIGIGVAILVWAARPIIAGWRVSHPEITLSKSELGVGESFPVIYQQLFKRAANVEHMEIKLLLRETATYQRGTDTYTVRQEDEIELHEFPSGPIQSNRSVREQLLWKIPRHGMHTFSAYRNKIQWFLRVQVQIAGWPDYEQEYEIKVLPELANE